MTAGDVMDASAALLNDPNRATYSYTVQLPYMRLALRNLEGKLIINGVPLFAEVSAVINYTAGASSLVVPTDLPSDFFLPVRLFEAPDGNTDESAWKELTETSWDKNARSDASSLTMWNFRENSIKLVPSQRNRDIRLHYIKSYVATIGDNTTEVPITNALNVLAFKNAEYLAKYVMNNPARATDLLKDGEEEYDSFLTALVRNMQHKTVRRKPYGLRSVVRRPYITS